MILVIGDIMLDKYTFGKIDRINPEAPVPILHITKEEYRLGGAANVANNLASLNADVILLGIANNDFAGNALKNMCDSSNIPHFLFSDGRPTIVKQRFIADMYSQQVLRVDHEEKHNVGDDIADKIVSKVIELNPNIVIISDYAKGIVTEYFMNELKQKYNGKILVDPKPKNINLYKDVFLIKPNQSEAKKYLDCDDVVSNVSKMSDDLNSNILVTLGKNGSILFDRSKNEHFSVESLAKDVYDVSGAGDTYLATLAYALDNNFELKNAMQLANKAASIVVGKVGTAIVTCDELFS